MSIRITAVLAVLAAALTLGGSAGAGNASQPPKKIDLSSPAAIDTYLRSIGVDPASVVKQNGLKNYAGPSCPGAGWTCTTSTRVVQVSHENSGEEGQGDNEFECKGQKPANPDTYPATNTCFIVQSGTTNHAKCEEESSDVPDASQVCDITQTGGKHNYAQVDQEITQNGGPSLTAEQMAKVYQQSSEKNVSQIEQAVRQRTATGSPQSQDAWQEGDVTQYVDGSQNFSNLHQTQDQNQTGGAAVQTQNTAPSSPPGFFCGNEKPAYPNQCGNIFQDATPGGGKNTSQLNQVTGERQTSSDLSPSQTQGSSSGGQEGDVHQANPQDVGENLNLPDQVLVQRQSSPGGTAIQNQVTDPGCCGVGTQIGGAKTREDIDQATIQSSDEPGAVQSSSLFGESHQTPTAPSSFLSLTAQASTNTCEIDQFGRINTDSGHFHANASGTMCASLVLDTECTTATGCGPPCTSCDFVTSLPSSATFGQDVAMPDYTAVPADYTSP